MAQRNEKIFERVRQEMEKNAQAGSRELYEIAKRADSSLGDTMQQFHARYVLPLKRERSGRTRQGSAAKRRQGNKTKRASRASASTPPKKGREAARSATNVVSERDRARSVLLNFAQDFAAAETKTEIVKVMSRLDDYVDQLSGNGS